MKIKYGFSPNPFLFFEPMDCHHFHFHHMKASLNKRPREEGIEEDRSLVSWENLSEKFTWERMKPLKDVLVYRDEFEKPYIEHVVEELKRFLILKTMNGDLDATQLSPSQKVDQAWHTLLELPQVFNHIISLTDSITLQK